MLRLDGYDRVLEVDAERRLVTVEAGISIFNLAGESRGTVSRSRTWSSAIRRSPARSPPPPTGRGHGSAISPLRSRASGSCWPTEARSISRRTLPRVQGGTSVAGRARRRLDRHAPVRARVHAARRRGSGSTRRGARAFRAAGRIERVLRVLLVPAHRPMHHEDQQRTDEPANPKAGFARGLGHLPREQGLRRGRTARARAAVDDPASREDRGGRDRPLRVAGTGATMCSRAQGSSASPRWSTRSHVPTRRPPCARSVASSRRASTDRLPDRVPGGRARRHLPVSVARPRDGLHRGARFPGHGARALLPRRRGGHAVLRRPPRTGGRSTIRRIRRFASCIRPGAGSPRSERASTRKAASRTPT